MYWLFNSFSDPLSLILLLFLFYRKVSRSTERLSNLLKIAQDLVIKLRLEPKQFNSRVCILNTMILLLKSCLQASEGERPLIRQLNPITGSNWLHMCMTQAYTHTSAHCELRTHPAFPTLLFLFPGSQVTGLPPPKLSGQVPQLGYLVRRRPQPAGKLPEGGAVSLSYSGAFVFCGLRAGGGEADLRRACR